MIRLFAADQIKAVSWPLRHPLQSVAQGGDTAASGRGQGRRRRGKAELGAAVAIGRRQEEFTPRRRNPGAAQLATEALENDPADLGGFALGQNPLPGGKDRGKDPVDRAEDDGSQADRDQHLDESEAGRAFHNEPLSRTKEVSVTASLRATSPQLTVRSMRRTDGRGVSSQVLCQ